MQGFKFKLRISVIALFILAVVGVFCYALYDLQVEKGADYFYESQNSITQTVVVKASRGEIVDRYNRVLVTNKVVYNVVINRSTLLRQEDPNGMILTLIEICDSFGVAHNDSLPLSKENPSEYDPAATETQMDRLATLLTARDIDPSLSAGEIFEKLCEHYSVDNELSFQQKRAAIGVRYELELRTVLNMTGYLFAEDVDTDLIAMIKEFDLPPVSVETGSIRVYNTEYAAHLLGRVGQMNPEEYLVYQELGYQMDAIIGKDGVEGQFETRLAGTDGSQTIQTNLDGSLVGIVREVDPVPGENIRLTIDIALQAVAENVLESSILELRETEDGTNAKGGAIVVVEVGTGDLLAAASYPSFSLETFQEDYESLLEDPLTPMVNRAFNGLYEPGSTFKMVSAAAALEESAISSGTVIRDEGIYTFYEDYQPVCWAYSQGGTHGDQTVIQALGNSCNYFFYEAGRLTGIDAISAMAKRLGLGVSTGIELPESLGIVAGKTTREENGGIWMPGDTLQAAIGQSDNLFTPLQLANYVATLANDGVRMQCHILDAVVSQDYSEVTETFEPVVLEDLQLKDDTIYAIQEGMRSVVTMGTAYASFYDSDIAFAAKTGSAQIGQEAANGVFVCYAPYDAPEIAVAVVVEKGGSGAALATIARQVAEYYFSINDSFNEAPGENTLLP